ncbi:MAG: hypothetical protein LBS96_01075 [Oscillospiraceae bacterium]|jgi:ABC-type glycerol-3-phosphate transport system permease component|nr:hypothetical protein [Oscillospiraceae bacterium]
MKNLRGLAAFYGERRWNMALFSLVAGLFTAPFLYWNCIFMRIVINAAHSTDLLLGLNFLYALGGLLLLTFAALGVGACLSALRGELDGAGAAPLRAIHAGLRRCAGCSLLTGALLGLSLSVMRVGLVDLHALYPAGAVRVALAALLVLQFSLLLPLCLLTLCQADALQATPFRALAAAWRQLLPNLGRHWLFSLATVLPLILFFVWQNPVMTFLGFLVVMLIAFAPLMLLWLRHSRAALLPPQTPLHQKPVTALLAIGLGVSAVLGLALPLLRQGSGAMQSSLRETIAFMARLLLQDADNGTFRDLLSDSSSWLVLLIGLLGSTCCVLAAYFCACYSFRRRRLLFAFTVLLQLLPLLASFSSTDQLLRNLGLPEHPAVMGLVWSLLYLGVALLLYRRFAKLRFQINTRQVTSAEEWRLFFYNVFPKVRLHVLALAVLVSFGCWNDALAPFWWMKRLGAFSVSGYVWQQTLARERILYLIAFVAVALLTAAITKNTRERKKEPSKNVY